MSSDDPADHTIHITIVSVKNDRLPHFPHGLSAECFSPRGWAIPGVKAVEYITFSLGLSWPSRNGATGCRPG